MTLDPLAVVGAITAMGTLLLFIVRAFATGAIMSRSVVPREDYEALRTINASYAEKFGQQTDAVRILSAAVEKLAPKAAR